MPDGMPVAGPRAGAWPAPRGAAVLQSGLAAAALLGRGMLAVRAAGDAAQAGLLLRWSPPVVLAPMLAMRRCSRAAAPARSAGRLAARVVALAVLLLAPLLLLWGVCVTGAEHLLGARPFSFADDLAWLPLAAAVLWGTMALYGIAPASLLQYLICRHYLRRRPCFAEGDTR